MLIKNNTILLKLLYSEQSKEHWRQKFGGAKAKMVLFRTVKSRLIFVLHIDILPIFGGVKRVLEGCLAPSVPSNCSYGKEAIDLKNMWFLFLCVKFSSTENLIAPIFMYRHIFR